ncbi:MAG: protein kinase domain-containing protein, partial [Gemmataceae bacterium]
MVGAFNETQVMDWGLAKVLDERREMSPSMATTDLDATAEPDPTEIKSLRDAETQAGSILGTPAFMAPEQAIGAVDHIDRRTDVFGLGAILAVILTGKPPFTSGSAETTRVKAATGDVAECFSRLDASGAEPDLIAMCKRCLSPKPTDRPANAKEVATALVALRVAADERARRAEIDRERAEVAAAEQRLRTRLRTRLLMAIFGACVVAGGAVVYEQKVTADRAAEDARRANEDSAREAKTDQERAAAVAVSTAAIEQMYSELETGRWMDANSSLARALDMRKRTLDLPADVGTAIAQAEKDLAFATEFERIRYAIIDLRAADGTYDRESFVHLYKDILNRYGVTNWQDADRLVSVVASSRIRTMLDQALEVYDDSTDPAVRLALSAIRKRVRHDLDPHHRRFFDAVQSGDSAELSALADDPATYHLPTSRITELAFAFSDRTKRLAVFRRGHAAYPLDIWFPLNLAHHLVDGAADERWEAVAFARSAVALRPQSASAALLLAKTLVRVARPDEGVLVALRGLDLAPDDVVIRIECASVLWSAGQRAAAEEQSRRALALQKRLVENSPETLSHRVDLGRCQLAFADLLRDSDRPADSLEWYGKAIDALGAIFAKEPFVVRTLLWTSHWHRCQAYHSLTRFDEAAKDAKRMVELRPPDLAWAHFQLGFALDRAGQSKEAEEALDRGLAFRERAAKAGRPGKKEARLLLALYLFDYGMHQSNADRHAPAAELFGRAAVVYAAVAADGDSQEIASKRRWSHQFRATALRRLGKHADALPDWEAAAELCPKEEQPRVRAYRAMAQLQAGRVAEAVAEVAELTKSPNWDAGQWYDFSCVYALASAKIDGKKAEYADCSMEILQQAVKAGWKNHVHMKQDKDLDPLRDRDDFKKLLAELEAKEPKKEK